MINTKAPEFKAKAFHEDKIKEVDLSNYSGKWLILFFYPADFTFICPTELRELAKNYSNFKKMNVEILSISTDTAFVHKAWHESSEALKMVDFPMVADPNGKICKAYGTYVNDEGLSLRATFIIDPDGIIKSSDMNDNTIGRNVDELIRKIQALKHVRENSQELCPVNWKAGEKTIKIK